MAESPVTKLARLVGGAAMLPGSLGHQALGQLLISGSNAVEVAGANVAMAAAYRQSNAALQVAVGSMVPAVVVDALSKKEQRRLEALNTQLSRQQQLQGDQGLKRLAEQITQQQKDLETRSEELRSERERMKEVSQKLENQQAQQEALAREVQELRGQNTRLELELKTLESRLGEYAAASAASEQKQRDAKPIEVTLETKTETKTETRQEESAPRTKHHTAKEPEKPSHSKSLAADSTRKSYAHTNTQKTKKSATSKKGKPPTRGK